MSDLRHALGCDSMRGASYESFKGDDGPPFQPMAEEGRDCYRDGSFLGRVHVFEHEDAADAIGRRQVQAGQASHQPACQGEQLQVITGGNWAVVTRGTASADEVRERTGGRTLPMESETTTFVSYILPCTGDAEPD